MMIPRYLGSAAGTAARLLAVSGVSIAAAMLSSCAAPEPAELVLRGGRIHTMDAETPSASAVASREGRIVYVGDDEGAAALIGTGTEVVDLEGKTVIPGFIEGHGHFLGLGTAALRLDLLETRTYDEIIWMVREAAAKAEPGEWILGRGWHQSKWDPAPDTMVRGFPTHEALSAASPSNPVWITHASGHAGLANAEAMRIAGIGRSTRYRAGGEIIRDGRGEATGVFVELAQSLISTHVPTSTTAYRIRAIEKALEVCAANGVTSFQDAGSKREIIGLYKELAAGGRLTTRLWVMEGSREDTAIEGLFTAPPEVGLGGGMLTIRAVKLGIDGALGSRSAWLMEPYDDDDGQYGHATMSAGDIERISEMALDKGYQVCVHAIGDRANHEVLNAFERAFSRRPDGGKGARFRIEHAQILDENDIPRFAKLGVIASMQGIHCTSDRPWAPARLGEGRIAEGGYVWRKLLDSGVRIVNGTDVPVERIDPIASFHASVTRQRPDGTPPGGFDPGQKMSRMEALRSYTLDAAYGAFEEDVKGSITTGKYTDMTVLSADIMTVPDDEILKARVEMTIVGGTVRFRRTAE